MGKYLNRYFRKKHYKNFKWAYPWNQQVHFRLLSGWKTTTILYKFFPIEVFPWLAHWARFVSKTKLCYFSSRNLWYTHFEQIKFTETWLDFSLKTFEYPVIIIHLTKILMRTLKLIKFFLNRIFSLWVAMKRKFIFPDSPAWAGIWYNWKSF